MHAQGNTIITSGREGGSWTSMRQAVSATWDAGWGMQWGMMVGWMQTEEGKDGGVQAASAGGWAEYVREGGAL